VGGSIVNIVGYIEVETEYGDETIRTNILVVDNNPFPFVLGMDMLGPMNHVANLKMQTVKQICPTSLVRDPFAPGCVYRDLKEFPTYLWIRREYVPAISALLSTSQSNAIIAASKDPETYEDIRNDILDLPRSTVLQSQYMPIINVASTRQMPSHA